MIWPFKRRKPKTPEPQTPKLPPINEDWQAGDLALCLDGSWAGGEPGPALDSIYRVLSVGSGRMKHTGLPAWGLMLAGWDGYYDAMAFRKVRPDAEECSAEFKALIDLTIRKRQKVEADQ